jgi:branched-subunit amino acid ABC-type transport system permease component
VNTFLTFTALGLVLGAVYAIAASGLVLTYNTSGVFNFAHGAQAMIGAFTYYQVHDAWGIPTAVALLLVLGLLGPAMGLALHVFVMRGLRDTEPVTKIVVTVAILLGLVSLSQWFWNPQESRVPEMFFGPNSTVTIAGVVLRYHEVICLVAALVIAIALRLLFMRTRAGVLMRATVDDPDLLRLAGHDPDRVAAFAWMLGSSLAVLAGVLITPVIGTALEAITLTLLVIDAFAAALFGRLRSIPLTFVGALVLGLASSYLIGYGPTSPWVSNLRQALPMVLLFLVLLVLPHDRLRGTAVRSRERYEVPSVTRAAVWAVVLVVGVVAFRQLIDAPSVGALLVGLSFAIVALSLTLLTGYAGEVNLAPLAFAAIATIVAFHTGIHGTGLDARISLGGLLAGVLASAATGALVALPALRLRGLYLALATLGFGVFVSAMVLRDTVPHTVLGRTFTVFPGGSLLVPPLSVGPLDLGNRDTFLVVLSVVFAALGVGLVALRNSGYGRRLAAMKDSPAASAMLGQRLVRLKLSVFALSTAIAGLGGIFMSMALTSVSAEHFVLILSLSVVMLTVVGGIGYVSGALFGGLLAGAGLTATVTLFNDIGQRHPDLAGSMGVLSHIVLASTALAGISVARNPSGLLHDVFAAHRRLAGAPEVRYVAGGVQVLLYGVALAGWFPTPVFVVASLTLWMTLPRVGAALRPTRVTGAVSAPTIWPELEGVSQAYSAHTSERLDRELGIVLPSGGRRRSTDIVATARTDQETVHVPA